MSGDLRVVFGACVRAGVNGSRAEDLSGIVSVSVRVAMKVCEGVIIRTGVSADFGVSVNTAASVIVSAFAVVGGGKCVCE